MYFVALYDYDAVDDTELSLQEGDHLTLISKDDSGWWEGKTMNGKTGVFPANYVEEISEQEAIRVGLVAVEPPKPAAPPPPASIPPEMLQQTAQAAPVEVGAPAVANTAEIAALEDDIAAAKADLTAALTHSKEMEEKVKELTAELQEAKAVSHANAEQVKALEAQMETTLAAHGQKEADLQAQLSAAQTALTNAQAVAATASASATDGSGDEVLRSQNAAMTQELSTLQAAHAECERLTKESQDALSKSEAVNADLQSRVDLSKQQYEELKKENENLKSELATVRQQKTAPATMAPPSKAEQRAPAPAPAAATTASSSSSSDMTRSDSQVLKDAQDRTLSVVDSNDPSQLSVKDKMRLFQQR